MKIELKLSYIFGACAVLMLLTSCGSTNNSRSIRDYDELREAISNQTFEIQHQWALPMGGAMIDLMGNPNFIRFNKDSVDLFLPYFGVRHGGGGYNPAEGGLVYKGLARDFSITEESKRSYLIKLEGRQDQDVLDFSIKIYPNGSANTSVIMTLRQNISYRGNVSELPAE